MTEKRRSSDIDIAVLAEKVDALSKNLVKHMEHEEDERVQIWKELRNLDRKSIAFFTILFTSAGGPNVLEFTRHFM